MTKHIVQPWDPGVTYAPGKCVTHNSKIYKKLDDGDNSEPDDIGGGWVAEGDESRSNLQEFNAIAASFEGYEARKQAAAAAKASAEAKLAALGLTAEELKALGL